MLLVGFSSRCAARSGNSFFNRHPTKTSFYSFAPYHGWRRGFEPTANPRGTRGGPRLRPELLMKMVALTSIRRTHDRLLCGGWSSGIGCSVQGTNGCVVRDGITICRVPFRLTAPGASGEKMVDTALVSDLLYLAADKRRQLACRGWARRGSGSRHLDGRRINCKEQTAAWSILLRGGLKNSNPKMGGSGMEKTK